MKQFFTFLAAVVLTASTYAQVGIGTTTPATSAALDITSTTKGLLIPRMTTAQRNLISSPVTGLMIHNTDNGAIETYTATTGLWFKVGMGQGASISNTAVGINALNSNVVTDISGIGNNAYGYNALQFNTSGFYNTANGTVALNTNTTGNSNTANGAGALQFNTTGNANTANGAGALNSNTVGDDNTANGDGALFSNTSGFGNTANGQFALRTNNGGGYNTANGSHALYSNIEGDYNTANGHYALYSNKGSNNTANGHNALYQNTWGKDNTATGFGAGDANTTGSENTFIGTAANVGSNNLTNATAIGYGAIVNTSNTIQLGNSFITDVITSGTLGIGTPTPDASAALDITSTTKGLLPPRMTTDERNLITSAAKGLIVFNTTLNTLQINEGDATTANWVSLSAAASTCGLSIGDTHQGGIIFYLDASGCHGLIAAPGNQSNAAAWWNGSNMDTRAYGSGLFEGKYNIQMINRGQGGTTSAAAICANYGDLKWYLPSIEELNLMYENIGQGNALGLGNIGGFVNNYYWSSTEHANYNAWGQNFYYGDQSILSKDYPASSVRAVRAF